MDTGKIGVPTLWGLVLLALKLAKSLWFLTILGAIKFFASFLFVIAIVIASLFYGIKSAFSYTSTKRRYQLDVARNLYFKNLGSNLGALLRLVDEAEQQEACKVILAFYVLSSSTSEFLTTEQIDQQAELLLQTLTGIEIDFDVEDALRDLVGLGVVYSSSEGWKSLAVEDAIERISETRNQRR